MSITDDYENTLDARRAVRRSRMTDTISGARDLLENDDERSMRNSKSLSSPTAVNRNEQKPRWAFDGTKRDAWQVASGNRSGGRSTTDGGSRDRDQYGQDRTCGKRTLLSARDETWPTRYFVISFAAGRRRRRRSVDEGG